MFLMVGVLFAGCASRPAAPAGAGAATLAPATFVIPTDLGTGQVEITVLSVYPYGQPMRLPISVKVNRGTISGPVTARVLANGFGGNGVPSEVVVRQLTVSPMSVAAGQRRGTEIVWDGLDEKGVLVPADTYSLVLEFGIEDGGQSRRGTAGATLQFGR